jgi:hypothetical protein
MRHDQTVGHFGQGMAIKRIFCYTILMRSLCLTLGFLSVLVIVTTSVTQALTPMFVPDEAKDAIASLFTQVEWAVTKGDEGACDALQPIPLYDHGPSVDQWYVYCVARVKSEAAACMRIPATIVPDLREHCLSHLQQ